jgi:hypothetical protein
MIRDDVCGVPWSHIESAQGMYTQAHHRSPLTAQGWCLEFERDVCLISGNSTSGPAFYVALVITTKALGLTSNEYADAETVISVAVDLLTRREMAQAQNRCLLLINHNGFDKSHTDRSLRHRDVIAMRYCKKRCLPSVFR